MQNPGTAVVWPRQQDVSRFYGAASVVVNLSDKARFVETFGLTALEAMSAGLPVVVPTVGGIAEMVDDGVNGYKIDVARLDAVADALRAMLGDADTYRQLSAGALRTAAQYDAEQQVAAIAAAIDDK